MASEAAMVENPDSCKSESVIMEESVKAKENLVCLLFLLLYVTVLTSLIDLSNAKSQEEARAYHVQTH